MAKREPGDFEVVFQDAGCLVVIKAELLAFKEDPGMVVVLDLVDSHIEGDSSVIVSQPSLEVEVLSGFLISIVSFFHRFGQCPLMLLFDNVFIL